MNDERKKILDMLAEGKINSDEAAKLLDAVGSTATPPSTSVKSDIPKFLYVKVDGNGDKVNIKIPLKLVKSGMKIAALMPDNVRGKVDSAMHSKGLDFDLSNLNSENVDEFLSTLKDFTIDVDSADNERVKIYCE